MGNELLHAQAILLEQHFESIESLASLEEEIHERTFIEN